LVGNCILKIINGIRKLVKYSIQIRYCLNYDAKRDGMCGLSFRAETWIECWERQCEIAMGWAIRNGMYLGIKHEGRLKMIWPIWGLVIILSAPWKFATLHSIILILWCRWAKFSIRIVIKRYHHWPTKIQSIYFGVLLGPAGNWIKIPWETRIESFLSDHSTHTHPHT